MPSSHLILCHPLLFLPSIFASISIFSNELLFSSGGQSIGASVSASVVPMNVQGWFPLGLTGLIFLLSKGLSRASSNTTIWKHQFFSSQPSLWSNSHTTTSLLFNTLSRFVIAFLPRSKHGNPENTGKRFHFTLWRLGSGVEESCLQRSWTSIVPAHSVFMALEGSWPRASGRFPSWPWVCSSRCSVTSPFHISFLLQPFSDDFFSLDSLPHCTLKSQGAQRTSPAWPRRWNWVSAAWNPGLSLYGKGPWHQIGQGLAQDHTASQRQIQIQSFLLTGRFQCSILPASHSVLADLQTHILTWTWTGTLAHLCTDMIPYRPSSPALFTNQFHILCLFVYGLPWWLRW